MLEKQNVRMRRVGGEEQMTERERTTANEARREEIAKGNEEAARMNTEEDIGGTGGFSGVGGQIQKSVRNPIFQALSHLERT